MAVRLGKLLGKWFLYLIGGLASLALLFWVMLYLGFTWDFLEILYPVALALGVEQVLEAVLLYWASLSQAMGLLYAAAIFLAFLGPGLLKSRSLFTSKSLTQLALSHLCNGRYHKAVKCAQEAILRKQGFLESHVALASAFGYLERPDEARSALEGFGNVVTDFVETHDAYAQEVKDRVLEGLRKAGLVEGGFAGLEGAGG